MAGGGRGTAGRWENVEMGGKELLRAGSGERMDASAFIGRGCSVIAQAARGERQRARGRGERERGVTFSMEEREATEIERRGDTGNVR
jgi:hypothetical protein